MGLPGVTKSYLMETKHKDKKKAGSSKCPKVGSSPKLDASKLPVHDIEPLIGALNNINIQLAILDSLWEDVGKESENLLKFLDPERPSMVLERLAEVPGLIAGVAGVMFGTLRTRLGKIKKVSEEILDSDKCWNRICKIRSRWTSLLNRQSEISNDELSRQVRILKLNFGSILQPTCQIAEHLVSMGQRILDVRDAIDQEIVGSLKDVKITSAAGKHEISLCRTELQNLCNILDDFVDLLTVED